MLVIVLTLLSLSYGVLGWPENQQHPVFHFTPPSDWMNDPNGLVYYNGYYHMFYQFNPTSPYRGDIHWGHAASPDLINWVWLPPALAPVDQYDNQGVFSGSITITDSGPVIMFTGQTGEEVLCLAFPANLSDPYLVTWNKYAENPVLSQPRNVGGFRDPTEAWIGPDGRYYMLVGSAINNGPACVFQLSSQDFIHWEEVNVMVNASFPPDDGVWECPDFFQVDENTWVFKHSYANRDWWITGTYDEVAHTFSLLEKGVIDWGIHYASKRFNANGKIIHFGWTQEVDPPATAAQRGWEGCQSVPREVTLGDDGAVYYYPAKELEQLRKPVIPFATTLKHGNEDTGVYGNQLDIVANITGFDENSEFGFVVGKSTKNSELTTITFTNVLYFKDMFPSACSPYNTYSVDNLDDCEDTCSKDNFCQSWSYLNNTCFIFNDFCPVSFLPEATSSWKPSVVVDTLESSLNDSTQALYYVPWDPTEQPLQVRLLYDHSVGELYLNRGKSVVTFRVYPITRGSDQGVQVFADADQPIDFNLQIYPMSEATFVLHS